MGCETLDSRGSCGRAELELPILGQRDWTGLPYKVGTETSLALEALAVHHVKLLREIGGFHFTSAFYEPSQRRGLRISCFPG